MDYDTWKCADESAESFAYAESMEAEFGEDWMELIEERELDGALDV